MDQELEMFFRAFITGEKDVIEHMEAEAQGRVVQRCMLAKEMKPAKEEWEKLGFSFKEIPDDDVLYMAKLPVGWNLRPTENSYWTEILDENDNVRGQMFYKSSFYDRSAHMFLKTRYKVVSKFIDDTYNQEIYFGNDNEKLYVAGVVNGNNSDPDDVRKAYWDTVNQYRADAELFADNNYPEWQNVHAYWDLKKEDIQSLNRKLEDEKK